MANRSFIYTKDLKTGKTHGLSEWNWEIPNVFKFLVQWNAVFVDSDVFNGPLIVQADFKTGLKEFSKVCHNLKIINFLKKQYYDYICLDASEILVMTDIDLDVSGYDAQKKWYGQELLSIGPLEEELLEDKTFWSRWLYYDMESK